MTHVTYIVPSLGVGGTEGQLILLMRGLVRDHSLTVICTRHDGAFSGDARRLGAQVRVLGLRSGWDPRATGKIAALLRGHPPDIVHTFLFGFDLCANRAAHAVGVPVVLSSRRQLATWKKWRHLWIQRKANAFVDGVVANSGAVARFAIEQEGLDPGLMYVIPNGIDADSFVANANVEHARRRYKIPPERRVVGIVANFSPVKDYPLFVAMAERLVQQRDDVHFLAVGAGPLAKNIEDLVEKKGLWERFTRVSTICERPDLYAIMDVCVLCSKVEGFPNAIIEAMAAGTPVVAADVGGVPELVINGQTGRLVASRDPEDFAEAVAGLLDHPEGARRMAAAAAAFVRRELTVDQMVNTYRALYADLLEKSRGKAR